MPAMPRRTASVAKSSPNTACSVVPASMTRMSPASLCSKPANTGTRSADAATVTARPTMRMPRAYGRSSRGRTRSALLASDRLAASSCQTWAGISREFTSRFPSRMSSLLLFDLAPATRPVVCDDLGEHLSQRARVDLLILTDRDGPASRVVMAAGNDAFGIRNDPTVVEKYVHMIFCSKQCTDVSVQHEVWLDPPLDRFGDSGIGRMN